MDDWRSGVEDQLRIGIDLLSKFLRGMARGVKWVRNTGTVKSGNSRLCLLYSDEVSF